jgi:hypothetical protein
VAKIGSGDLRATGEKVAFAQRRPLLEAMRKEVNGEGLVRALARSAICLASDCAPGTDGRVARFQCQVAPSSVDRNTLR